MRVVTFTIENQTKIFSAAERILKSGGVIIGPSDTVYGIYCDATNPAAIKKIFELKRRSSEKALPVFVKDIPAARRIAYIDDRKAGLLEKIWPGPATVVFHHKEKLPRVLTGGLDTIGVRIPANEFLTELLNRVDFPLAQTSANISGSKPVLSAAEAEVIWEKEKNIRLIIDGGELKNESSTVADFTKNQPVILRSGVITKEDFYRLLDLDPDSVNF